MTYPPSTTTPSNANSPNRSAPDPPSRSFVSTPVCEHDDASSRHSDGSHPPPPTYDSFDRAGYNYTHTPEQFVESQPLQRKVLESTAWNHARFDLNTIERVLNLADGTFLPWYAHRPDHGYVKNFPVKLPVLFMVKDVFIRAFNVGLASIGYSRTDPKQMKVFSDAFPSFGPDDANNDFKWHNRVFEYGTRFGVYIPPAHTLRDGNPYGIWFSSLPECVQRDVENTYRFVLSGAIRSRTLQSLRQEFPRLYNKIQNCSPDGYVLLSDLARSAGNHPLLRSYTIFQMEPRQSADQSLDAYITTWLQFLQNQLLDGLIFSDRYFHQQFLANLHPTVRHRLGNYLHQSVVAVPLNKRLPASLDPERFSNFIEQHVEQFGTSYLLNKTPRLISSSSDANPSAQAVRSIVSVDTSTNDSTLNALIIAAIRQPPGPCLLCQSTDHVFVNCPSFEALQKQPRMIVVLQRALQKALPPSATNQPASNRHSSTRQVRQLTAQVDLIDLDTTAEAGEGAHMHDADLPTFDLGEGPIDISPSPATSPPPDFH